MKKIIVSLLITKCLVVSTLSATPVSMTHLQQRVDSLISLQHQSGEPGGAIAVIQDGKLLLSKTFGLMNLEHNRPVEENTLFDIASVAKQFTAYAVWMLHSQGKLHLDDDIRLYLPQLPRYDYTITIRNLIQHTSGIASTDWLRLLSGMSLDEVWYQEDEFSIIKKYPTLNFEPGTSHVYSNAGYSLLAQIVESVSGMRFAEYSQKHIFKPMGMNQSFIQFSPEIYNENMARGYGKSGEGFTDITSADEYSYGGGNIHTSLSDITQWAINLMSKQGKGHDFYLHAIEPYNTLQNGDTLHYTYGFYVRKHKEIKVVEHSGGVPGFRNNIMFFPNHKLAIIVLSNTETLSTRALALGVAEFFLADYMQVTPAVTREEAEVDPSLFFDYQGVYEMADGMELQFVAEKDTFWLVMPGDSRFQLFAESDTHFFLKAFDAQCTFVREPNGDVNQMIWHQRGRNVTSNRVEEIIPVNTDQLPAFAGTYRHSTLNADYAVTFEDDVLTLHLPEVFSKYLGFNTSSLSHINGDKFLTERMGVMEFTRDEKNNVNGFILRDIGRLQNVVFTL